jgi:hypothetical protein
MSRIAAIITGIEPTEHLRCDTCDARGDLSAHLHRRTDGSAQVKCLACGTVLINSIDADIATLDPDDNEDAT